MNKIVVAIGTGACVLQTIDSAYKIIKNCEIVKDIHNNIKEHEKNKDINNIVVRTDEEKDLDRKMLAIVKEYYKIKIGKKYDKNIDKYINSIPKHMDVINNYKTYTLLIDKMGMKQKMLDDVKCKLTKREVNELVYEYKIRTNENLVHLLNKLYKNK